MKYVITIFCCVLGSMTALSQDGYRIGIDLQGADIGEAYLAYYLGNKQFVQDTAVSNNGMITFQGKIPLDPGFYLVVFPPDNRYFQLLITKDEQNIDVTLDPAKPDKPAQVSGSSDSELFYEYVSFITEKRPAATALQERISEVSDKETKKQLEERLRSIDNEVKEKQNAILKKHPESLTAMLIQANREIQFPEFSGSEEEINEQKFRYYRRHFFDHIPLHDPRVVRTPFLHEKIDYFINKLTVQDPDSLIKAIDYVLGQIPPENLTFQVYLVHFLNTYAQSKIVGMDAVYVHLVNEYYARGKAPWTEEEQMNKILDNAARLEPILIGKIAPDLSMQKRSGESIRLHEINAEYTVLFFWDPECGHCKKSIPKIIDFYNEYQSKGVEIFAVCTKLKDGVKDCWEAIDEREMGAWVNTVDPFLKSRFKQKYDVRLTPRIYVLDSDKRIVMKSIGAEQLPEVIDMLSDKKS